MDTLIKNYSRITNNLVHRVNETRGLGRRTRDSLIPKKERLAFIEAVQLTTQQGLTASLMSEATIRLKIAGHIMGIKPNVWVSQIDENDLFIATGNRIIEGNKLPTHFHLHQQLYQYHSNIKAVLLSQPAAAMAFLAGGNVPAVKIQGLNISICFDSIMNFTATTDALFVENIGLITVGESIQMAAARADALNRICEIELQ
ncbi:MAG: class II aldolase/adducin family protein [Chloroflexota bacterium]